MQNAIYDLIDDEPITSLEIKSVKDTKANVINELIGLFAIQRNVAETGLKLALSDWTEIDESLDESIF